MTVLHSSLISFYFSCLYNWNWAITQADVLTTFTKRTLSSVIFTKVILDLIGLSQFGIFSPTCVLDQCNVEISEEEGEGEVFIYLVRQFLQN